MGNGGLWVGGSVHGTCYFSFESEHRRLLVREVPEVTMRRTTVIGAAIGALAGAVVELGLLTGWKLFFFLSLPGWFAFLLSEGHTTAPSVRTGAVNLLVYSALGALMGWVFAMKQSLEQAEVTPRNRLAKLVEHDWFALVSGMSAFLLSSILVVCLFSADAFGVLDPWLGSELATFMALVTLVMAPATSAIVVHNLIAGPLRRPHRRRLGHCINCGHSLTGNVSGVCPECGTAVKTP